MYAGWRQIYSPPYCFLLSRSPAAGFSQHSEGSLIAVVPKWLWCTGTLEYGLWNDTGAGQRCYRLSVRVCALRKGPYGLGEGTRGS